MTPRKRVVLEYDPKTKEITTELAFKNCTSYAVAFKVQSSFESGYVLRPCAGIVHAGQNFDVRIRLNDLQCLGRDVERDKFVIELASVDNDALTAADNVFYNEKLSIGMSQAAKDRLAFLNAEQKRKLMLNAARVRQQRILKYVGAGIFAILVAVFLFVDLCALSAASAWEGGKHV